MKIAVFGGTGHVSRYFIDELVSAGHTVRLLSRRAGPVRNGVEPLVGNALLDADVLRVIEGCQVVVNGVGRLKNEDGFYAAITSNILNAMKKTGVARYLLVTNSAVRLPSDSFSLYAGLGVTLFNLIFPRMIQDKERELQSLADSSVEWVAFRLPMVLDLPKLRPTRTDPRSLGGLFISNREVAKAIVQEIDQPKHVRSAPFLFRS